MHQSIRLHLTIALLFGAGLSACGSNDGSGPSPPPSPAPPPTASNPCLTAAAEAPADIANPGTVSSRKLRGRGGVGNDRGSVYDRLWMHRATGRTAGLLAPAPQATAEDVGEIAVLQDTGDLLIAPNAFDLRGAGLRFVPTGSGYDVTRGDSAFRTPLGSRLTLEDDDSMAFDLPFGFPFYGTARTRAFVNSDGNITFGEEDRASTERNVARLLTGPPRVAPFFADLDPSTGSGRVFASSDASQFTVTWCGVRGFDLAETVTVQATLLPDGGVEVRFGETIALRNAIVAVSPGRTGRFSPVDLSASGTIPGGEAAVGERFASSIDLDLVAVARAFYQTHSDSYDQLVIWTDVRVTTDSFAFETSVANEIRGLGLATFNQAAQFGSAGRLRSLVMMDSLGKYPADPQNRFLGENSTLALLGHEVGHRWLAFLRFRDRDRRVSEELLGRDEAHWSFFMDSDGSVMEGNDIEDLGGGSFRTRSGAGRYSLLDQYAMGLVTESQVPEFFYVESPINVVPSRDREDAPERGVTFAGTRRTVLIQDVVAAMGARQPSARDSPRVFRQAFIYVISSGRTLDRSQSDKIDQIRRQWDPFFNRAVNGRARVETRLRQPS